MLCTLFSLQPKAEIKACSGNMKYIQGENLITQAELSSLLVTVN